MINLRGEPVQAQAQAQAQAQGYSKDLLREAEVHELPATQLRVREDRQRQLFDRKRMDKMIESIRSVGQLQPGICRKDEAGELELVIGERRLRACLVLERPFKFCLLDEIEDPFLLEFIQLEENIQRDDLDWKEALRATARIHKLFIEKYGEATPGIPGGHKLKDTAEHLGLGYTILQEDVALAEFLEIPEVHSAPNKTTAKKIVKRMIDQVKKREDLEKALKNVKKLPEEQAPLTGEAREALTEKRAKEPPRPEPEDLIDQAIIRFNQRCLLGKMEDLILKFKDESFDVVFFDPPWGVEFDKNYKTGGGTKAYEDSKEFYYATLKIWLELLFMKMKPNSHLYMFFAIRYHKFVYQTLDSVGFETHGIPIIWYKKGAHSIRAPHKWPGLSYEPIAFARKGSKVLEKMGQPDHIETPMPTSRIKGIQPSAKHPQVYWDLIQRSCRPSETILDPMAGSGMMGVAAEKLADKLALNWWQIEIDDDYKTLQLTNLLKGYDEIIKRKADLDIEAPPPLEEGFESLRPGTPEWGEYFKNNPDQQDKMLQWRAQQAGKK